MASPTAYTPTFQGLMDLSPSLVIPPIHPIIWGATTDIFSPSKAIRTVRLTHATDGSGDSYPTDTLQPVVVACQPIVYYREYDGGDPLRPSGRIRSRSELDRKLTSVVISDKDVTIPTPRLLLDMGITLRRATALSVDPEQKTEKVAHETISTVAQGEQGMQAGEVA